jgi:hypothetical protein
MTLIKELIDIPARIQKGDFVLKLTEGVTRPDLTVKDYVVTPELKDCFDNALSFIQSSLQSNSSKASYLHGSFGSGKSHFMAILSLILDGNPTAKKITELAPVLTKHNPWITGKKFLLVPYHMIGAHDMESGILGGYVDYVRRHHPDAPIPGVYLAEGLFQDAQNLRQQMGDTAFFQTLNSSTSESGWGELAAGWDADRFTAAIQAGPGAEDRSQLISDLIKQLFKSYSLQTQNQTEAFVSLDLGLSVISKHAQSLGYDALLLFLDELILWLASRATDLNFIHREGQKLAKLVEAQLADRPIPVISFVARQRDLSDLVGGSIPGAERLNFSDALKHWEGRFHRITLEDRNLPAIAEKRVLRCKSDSARAELNAAFEQTAKVRDAVMTILLTKEGDRTMFRQLYPFSPALIQTLIAVSSVLQRERTALKVMMQLLVDQQDILQVGDIIPVGDLFDVVAHGDEAFSSEMAIHFNNAKRLYQQKLLPELEKKYGRRDDIAKLDVTNPKQIAFRNDDRLIKTLLLSALVPEVESLRGLTAERLAALNHGTIKSPIPGRESQEVLRRCQEWAASVGEIRIGEEASPSISVQLSGVDTDSILKQVEREDNRGNRIRLIREMLYEQFQVKGEEEFEQYLDFTWKNTKRTCQILFRNIRELPEASLENSDQTWKLIIDYPFDEVTHSPKDDRRKCEEFITKHAEGTKTLCWIPSFLSESAQKDLATLLQLNYVLAGERLSQYANHLSLQDRQTAKSLLENQRSVLRQRVRNHLDVAYGIDIAPEALDASASLELHEQFVSLYPSLELQPPTAANLADALQSLLSQTLAHEFPAAPNFEADVSKLTNLQKVYDTIKLAAQTADGRVEVERIARPLLRQIANPLRLGDMGPDATHFILNQDWKNHFNRKAAESGGVFQVSQLRQWIDQPKPMGLSLELQNLVILTFAEQTGRSCFRHNLPIDPSLKDLANDCEFREQTLPDETEWQIALERAQELLGIAITRLRNVSNVAELITKVQEKAKTALPDCQHYVQILQIRLEQLQLNSFCDRHTTATTTLVLVEQLNAAKPANVIKLLSAATIATTAAAMQACLSQSASLANALANTSWDIFSGLAQLTDQRQTEAEEILASLAAALSNDEHVQPLAPILTQVQAQTIRLLTQQPAKPPSPPAPPIAPPSPPPISSEQWVSQGSETDLDLTAATALLETLKGDLKPGQTIRLQVNWCIEGNAEPNTTQEKRNS